MVANPRGLLLTPHGVADGSSGEWTRSSNVIGVELVSNQTATPATPLDDTQDCTSDQLVGEARAIEIDEHSSFDAGLHVSHVVLDA